jgi:signal transduction histidine kinase
MPGTIGPAPFFLDLNKGVIEADPCLTALLGIAGSDEGIPLGSFLEVIDPDESESLGSVAAEEGAVIRRLRIRRVAEGPVLLLGAARKEAGIMQLRGVLTANDLALFRNAELEGSKEVDALAHIISHDLRAPLRGVTGFGHMLKESRGKALDEEGRDLLDRMLRETERMNQMLIALTRFSHIAARPLATEQFDLAAECRAIWKELDPSNTGTLDVVSSEKVQVDAELLRVLLKELLSNSLKFHQEGKELRVSFLSTAIEGGIMCAIVDDGVGFDMSCASKLFSPFQRMHPAGAFPGQGIGLAIVSKIAQKHGGRTWIASREGGGTVVIFTLRSGASGPEAGGSDV